MYHRSFGLAKLVSDMMKPGFRILDLGALSFGTTQAFLKQKCQCHVEDLIEYLAELKEGEDPIAALSEHLIPKPSNLKFDVVLCWDILNFLELDVIEHLIHCLAPHLKAGTVLHTMRYTGQLPEHPRRFKLLDDFCFEYVDDTSYPRIKAKGHSTVTLLKRMHRFSLCNTLMQRDGMDKNVTEHLLEYESTTSKQRLHGSLSGSVSTYFTDQALRDRAQFPGIVKLFKQLPDNARLLDCGRKAAQNRDATVRHAKELFMEDLFASMSWQKKIAPDHANDAPSTKNHLSEAMLRFTNGTTFDAILLWDFLNFCTQTQVQQLNSALLPMLQTGTLLHFVMFKGKGRPNTPAIFEMQNNGEVTIKGDVTGNHPRDIQSTAELMRLLPKYKLHAHHFGRLVTGESYQEFVLQCVSQ
ncbi:class I SAM-dependent methyltransferase [Marinibactrum halimedae]|uniref:Methyltransferase domain-containing protein n=1 Tax=Marinibactrum halimedae TaxID=1444977 RepID=A0AA37WN60_9GAMM|nr:class I SAM-dependent methyltransferase [Marinibactrum halimedae]MCD9460568.1 class I SAM-dependent methyltransferase [Marinibactrum halimedae]GLS27198.1 hypothetical protein GCM10007877_29170 [Marinibactrum halimedae]